MGKTSATSRSKRRVSPQQAKRVYVQPPPCKCGTCTRVTPHQIGNSITKLDVKLDAIPPGKRVSKYGKRYYESRKNRSDLHKRI